MFYGASSSVRCDIHQNLQHDPMARACPAVVFSHIGKALGGELAYSWDI
jgi:hypothetical protein